MTDKNIPVPPPVIKRIRSNWMNQTRRYKLITPLFGGGVIPGKPDPATAIRGPSVRGHLRFWWRATRGGEFADLKAMKQAEDALWGSTSTASAVNLTVIPNKHGDKFIAEDKDGHQTLIGEPDSIYSYVAFPLREIEDDSVTNDERYCVAGVEFTLELTYPKDHELDVASALWAWESFGGIGARTRRGFGALACTRIVVNGERQSITLPDATTIDDWILQVAEREKLVSIGKFPDNVPHIRLDKSMLRVTRSYSRSSQKSAELQAWIALINKLQHFRQNRQGKFGPSNWPEANAIRALFKRTPHPAEPTIGKFPRADFGLPIEFKFMDQENLPKTSLQGVDHDRLASPLILRPLLCANNQAVGLALILDTPRRPPGGVKLQDGRGNPTVAVDLAPGPPNEANFPPLNNETDILKAFLKTIN